MNFPTVLSPWYVVQRILHNTDLPPVEYYTSTEDGTTMFHQDADKAMLFMSLHSASRIASAEGAQVRALTTKDEAKEFRRD